MLGKNGQRLSKRNGVVSVNWYRDEGYLPEAICNYLALLGWSPGEDRESFTLAEMAAEFDLARVNKNAAQFDVDKLRAINGDKIRALEPADFAHRLIPFLRRSGLIGDPPSDQEAALLEAAAPLVQPRSGDLVEAAGLLNFLFVPEDSFAVDPADAERALGPDAAPVLQAAQRRAGGGRILDRRGHRGGSAHGADREAGTEAAGRVRPGTGRGDRTAGYRRRCSSRSSCSAGSGPSAGYPGRWPRRPEARAEPPVLSGQLAGPGRRAVVACRYGRGRAG